MDFTHVKGKKKGDVVLYALSTCVWCKKARTLLEELGVDYSFVYVDLLEMEDMVEAKDTMKHMASQVSFPTIIIDDKTVISGYQPDEIKKLLG